MEWKVEKDGVFHSQSGLGRVFKAHFTEPNKTNFTCIMAFLENNVPLNDVSV